MPTRFLLQRDFELCCIFLIGSAFIRFRSPLTSAFPDYLCLHSSLPCCRSLCSTRRFRFDVTFSRWRWPPHPRQLFNTCCILLSPRIWTDPPFSPNWAPQVATFSNIWWPPSDVLSFSRYAHRSAFLNLLQSSFSSLQSFSGWILHNFQLSKSSNLLQVPIFTQVQFFRISSFSKTSLGSFKLLESSQLLQFFIAEIFKTSSGSSNLQATRSSKLF